MVAVLIEELVHVGFLYADVMRVLLGPGEMKVFGQGMEPYSLGFSQVNWLWGQ